jgi:hypothetical protein
MLLLTYGVVGGFGLGLIFLPAVVCVGHYFESKAGNTMIVLLDFKRQCHEIFYLCFFFASNNPIPISCPKKMLNIVANLPRNKQIRVLVVPRYAA